MQILICAGRCCHIYSWFPTESRPEGLQPEILAGLRLSPKCWSCSGHWLAHLIRYFWGIPQFCSHKHVSEWPKSSVSTHIRIPYFHVILAASVRSNSCVHVYREVKLLPDRFLFANIRNGAAAEAELLFCPGCGDPESAALSRLLTGLLFIKVTWACWGSYRKDKAR